jgi:hypothetical protein
MDELGGAGLRPDTQGGERDGRATAASAPLPPETALPAEELIVRGQTIVHHGGGRSRRGGETEQSRLFSEIVSRPPELARRSPERSAGRRPATVLWWLLCILLIVIVAVPLWMGRPWFAYDTQLTQAGGDLSKSIASLEPGSAVLVAFDYDPATQGEMDLLAAAIVGHLMDQQARVIALSLLPAGPATAQNLLDSLAQDRARYRDGYGRTYANLGYLPGQAAAVRSLTMPRAEVEPVDYGGAPLRELGVMDGLYGLRSYDLVIELAAGQETLRWWIEQATTPLEIPLGAGVSASAAPLVLPYYESSPRQLVGMLGGAPEAIRYNAAQQGDQRVSGLGAVLLEAQYGGQLVLIALILAAAGYYAIRRLAARRGR